MEQKVNQGGKMQKLKTVIATLIVVIPIGVAAKVVVAKIIKSIHKRWKDADLFRGLEGE